MFHDEALHLSGRERSYEYGPSWGGSKVYWSVMATTTRIPRIAITAMFRQTFEDTAKVTDTFDHSYYVWLRVNANLKPGPQLVLRIKYLDDYTNDLDDRGSSYVCSYDVGKSGTDIPAAYPGKCRGESYIDAYLQASQRIHWALFPGSYVRLRLGWTHWTDSRRIWGKPMIYDQNPNRDEFLIKGYLLANF